MSTSDPYIIVRRHIVDDPRFAAATADMSVLGWWLWLRLGADAAWPSSADMPARCPSNVVAQLAADGHVVLYPRDRYRMPDYDIEREDRARAAAVGGRARAKADRGASGRWLRSKPAVVGSDGASGEPQPLSSSQRSASQPRETTTPPPPPAEGRRANGTNPRATGASPRAAGTSIRQRRDADKRGGAAELGDLVRRASNGETRTGGTSTSVGAILATVGQGTRTPATDALAPPPCPDGDTHRAHRSEHYRDGDRWRCRACEAAALW
jgi:hypothetical protein